MLNVVCCLFRWHFVPIRMSLRRTCVSHRHGYLVSGVMYAKNVCLQNSESFVIALTTTHRDQWEAYAADRLCMLLDRKQWNPVQLHCHMVLFSFAFCPYFYLSTSHPVLLPVLVYLASGPLPNLVQPESWSLRSGGSYVSVWTRLYRSSLPDFRSFAA